MAASSDPIGRTCPHCGSTITSEDFFCRACHKRFDLRGAETDATKPDELPKGSVLRLRNPILASLFSFAGVGLGQFYNGDLAKGLIITGLFMASSFLPVAHRGVTPTLSLWIMAGIWVVSLIDSPISAWRINHLAKEFSGASPLFWVEILILAGAAGLYFFTANTWYWVNLICPPLHFIA